MESDGLPKNWRWTPKKLENDSSSCAQDISNAFQCQIVSILPRMDQPSSPSRSSLGPSAWESPTVYRKLREEWACQGWARLSHVPKRLLSQDVWSCGCLRNDPVLSVLALVEGRNLQEWLHQFPRFSQKTIHWQPANSETYIIFLWSILAMMHRFYVAKGLLALRHTATVEYRIYVPKT